MPRTPDRRHGALYEEAINLDDTGTDPTEIGEIRRNGNAIKAKDGTGVYDLRSGSGLSEATHETLDSLVHNLAENYFQEVVRSGGLVTSIIAWTDSGKTTKVRETILTRTGGQVSQIQVKQYAAGSLVQTLTGVVTRSSGQVASIDWTET